MAQSASMRSGWLGWKVYLQMQICFLINLIGLWGQTMTKWSPKLNLTALNINIKWRTTLYISPELSNYLSFVIFLLWMQPNRFICEQQMYDKHICSPISHWYDPYISSVLCRWLKVFSDPALQMMKQVCGLSVSKDLWNETVDHHRRDYF